MLGKACRQAVSNTILAGWRPCSINNITNAQFDRDGSAMVTPEW